MQKETIIDRFLLRIDKDLKAKIAKIAKHDNRSLNGYIINVLKKKIDENK